MIDYILKCILCFKGFYNVVVSNVFKIKKMLILRLFIFHDRMPKQEMDH
jgi:hypothetical protein